MRRNNDVDRFKELLSQRGLRFTRERQELFDEVTDLKRHFDADSLYEMLKKKGSHISRDTVYRTMPLFLECGVLQKSVGDGRREYFERVDTTGHHDHMVCIGCGGVFEFKSDAIEKIQEDLCKEFQFKLVFHDHRLFGYCKKCQPAK